jgi:uncharacterized membrane protein
MKVLLVTSLVLNVLLAGALIGNVSHHMGRRFALMHERALVVELPPEKQKLFHEAMSSMRMEGRDLRKQIGETRERAIAVLTAPEFDEEAYQAEVDKLRVLRGLMMQRVANTTKELAKQFDPEERRALGGYLRDVPPP